MDSTKNEAMIAEAITFFNKAKELGIYETVKDLTGTFKDPSKITEKYSSQEIANFIVKDSKNDLGRAYDIAKEYFYRKNIRLEDGSPNPNWVLWSEVVRVLREKIYQAGLVEGKINTLKEKRVSEMREGKNLHTTYPIFVVYTKGSYCVDSDDDYIHNNSVFDYRPRQIAIDEDGECQIYLDETELEEDADGNYYDEEEEILYNRFVKECYYDKFETVCFTREAAEAYIKANRHNLRSPRIYVDAIPLRNREMIEVLDLLGDKW